MFFVWFGLSVLIWLDPSVPQCLGWDQHFPRPSARCVSGPRRARGGGRAAVTGPSRGAAARASAAPCAAGRGSAAWRAGARTNPRRAPETKGSSPLCPPGGRAAPHRVPAWVSAQNVPRSGLPFRKAVTCIINWNGSLKRWRGRGGIFVFPLVVVVEERGMCLLVVLPHSTEVAWIKEHALHKIKQERRSSYQKKK